MCEVVKKKTVLHVNRITLVDITDLAFDFPEDISNQISITVDKGVIYAEASLTELFRPPADYDWNGYEDEYDDNWSTLEAMLEYGVFPQGSEGIRDFTATRTKGQVSVITSIRIKDIDYEVVVLYSEC